MNGPQPCGPRIALVLPGGGARSAYQVGVLQAIASWYPPRSRLPFPILCGTSAGAINAAVLAARPRAFSAAPDALVRVWGGFHVGQVFRAGSLDMIRSGLRLVVALLTGGWLLPMPRALLDNSPLRALLVKNINFARLHRVIGAGLPVSIAVTATSLTSGESVAFVESSRPFVPWERVSRRGIASEARRRSPDGERGDPRSCFRRSEMAGVYHSDGAVRQSTPLAPAIHLGADRILVIGVRPPGMCEPMRRIPRTWRSNSDSCSTRSSWRPAGRTLSA